MIGQAESRRILVEGPGCEDCFIEVSLDLEWSGIEVIKTYFEQFADLHTAGGNNVHRIGIAVSELLENALKYSVKKRIRITMQQAENSCEFVVFCANSSDRINIERLRMRIKEMRLRDPLEYYLYRMRESVKDKLASPGLGLARVYHEAKADISARITKNENLVEIRAIIDSN